MKIYNEERWDEDDACVECGGDLIYESKVPGLCKECYAEMNPPKSIQNSSIVGTVRIRTED